MYRPCRSTTKNKEEIQKFEKEEIYDIFIKVNQIKLAFSMTWFMEILKIYLEERLT